MTVKIPYSEHVIQVDFGHGSTDHIKHITPDLQQQHDMSRQVGEQQPIAARRSSQVAVTEMRNKLAGMADL